MVLAAERGRDRGQFGEGVIAVTHDQQLVDRAARLLNRLDPAHFKPPQRVPASAGSRIDEATIRRSGVTSFPCTG